MRPVPQALQAHLDSGATTLCWCWRLTRLDGIRLGFTDHDRDVVFDATTYQAASGFTASDMRQSIGLNVDNLDVESALRSDVLNEQDLAAGLFDDAQIEIFRVNWQDPDQRVLMRRGSIGEVSRGEHAFTAEIRGLSHYLNQEQGRVYQFGCDADLGDGRCGVNLGLTTFQGSGTVSEVVTLRLFGVGGLDQFGNGWFSRGLLTWTSGDNNGRSMEIKLHTNLAASVKIELWQPMASTPLIGDAFTVTAGCDKQIGTCRDKFSNTLNFRGFPHMPGNDFITSYPNQDDPGRAPQ